MQVRWILLLGLVISVNALGQDITSSEKSYFLRLTDSNIFTLKTNPAWESFEKKARLGGVFYKYKYKADPKQVRTKQYPNIVAIQTIKVASKLLGSSGDMNAMIFGVKMGLGELRVKKIHTGSWEKANWRLYDVKAKEKPIGSILLAQEGRITTLYLMIGMHLDKDTGATLIQHIVTNMKLAAK